MIPYDDIWCSTKYSYIPWISAAFSLQQKAQSREDSPLLATFGSQGYKVYHGADCRNLRWLDYLHPDQKVQHNRFPHLSLV